MPPPGGTPAMTLLTSHHPEGIADARHGAGRERWGRPEWRGRARGARGGGRRAHPDRSRPRPGGFLPLPAVRPHLAEPPPDAGGLVALALPGPPRRPERAARLPAPDIPALLASGRAR